MKLAKSLIIVGILFTTLLLWSSNCHYSDTIVSQKSEIILPDDSGAVYRFKKRYFILVPGDTALFYGTRSCTLSRNGEIIDHTPNDSLYLRIITQKPIKKKDSKGKTLMVFPRLYQEAKKMEDLNKNAVIRYFEKSDSAIKQIAFEKEGSTFYPDKKYTWILPKIIEVGPYGTFQANGMDIPRNNTWKTSPLIEHPFLSITERMRFEGYSVAARVISLPNSGELPYVISGHYYTNGIFVRTYYSLNGEIEEDGKLAQVSGFIYIVRSYFTDRGMIDQFQHTSIQKTFFDGTVVIEKEIMYVSRGPEGAPTYPEFPIPDTVSWQP